MLIFWYAKTIEKFPICMTAEADTSRRITGLNFTGINDQSISHSIPSLNEAYIILFQVICSALPEGLCNATTCSSSSGFQRLTSLLYADFVLSARRTITETTFLKRNSVTRVDKNNQSVLSLRCSDWKKHSHHVILKRLKMTVHSHVI